jgi:hypothetical protein
MRTIEITLGGKPYTITELPSRKNAGWRKSIDEEFGGMLSIAEGVQAADLTGVRMGDVTSLIRTVGSGLLGGVDAIKRLLIAYSPELTADAEWIEENAYDSEIQEAFARVLTLAYPFAVLVEKILSVVNRLPRMTGSATNAIGTNSVSPSGDAGATS